MDSVTLTEFLLARIDEDEDVANSAREGDARWRATVHDESDYVRASIGNHAWTVADCDGEGHADHIARHDPARVLAECEAKRRLVEPWLHDTDGDADDWAYGVHAHAWEFSLRTLALPYADHADFRDEWKP